MPATIARIKILATDRISKPGSLIAIGETENFKTALAIMNPTTPPTERRKAADRVDMAYILPFYLSDCDLERPTTIDRPRCELALPSHDFYPH
ncbi:hypothetical protein [Bosea sp. LjRoot237]|uniref:hypothetical protein n=1 Tax=Bosea sp. LjRoot237 TaxID=3342292 RepID=UPI003ECF8B4B